jgi:hypothetical protein
MTNGITNDAPLYPCEEPGCSWQGSWEELDEHEAIHALRIKVRLSSAELGILADAMAELTDQPHSREAGDLAIRIQEAARELDFVKAKRVSEARIRDSHRRLGEAQAERQARA